MECSIPERPKRQLKEDIVVRRLCKKFAAMLENDNEITQCINVNDILKMNYEHFST